MEIPKAVTKGEKRGWRTAISMVHDLVFQMELWLERLKDEVMDGEMGRMIPFSMGQDLVL